MTIQDVYIDFFYGHPLFTMALWGAYAVIFWTMLARLADAHNEIWRWVNRLGAVCITAVILYGTVLNRTSGERQLLLYPLSFLEKGNTDSEHFRSAMVNYLLFIPYGLTLPFALPDKIKHKAGVAIWSALALSAFVETAQYVFGLGFCEMDDLILNTLGAAVGALAYAVATDKGHRNDGQSKRL